MMALKKAMGFATKTEEQGKTKYMKESMRVQVGVLGFCRFNIVSRIHAFPELASV